MRASTSNRSVIYMVAERSRGEGGCVVRGAPGEWRSKWPWARWESGTTLRNGPYHIQEGIGPENSSEGARHHSAPRTGDPGEASKAES